MKKFEYKTLWGDVEKGLPYAYTLEELGEAGWELVCCTPTGNSFLTTNFIFKREKL